ncbi:hypothetical protein BKA70DRAFT_1233618 [Coprinopsis sp. MPI-PUGE-AT-0042]|nr:hypothetical protein BKA70DRAFT_1233618 [Coprinopsis sp. MPI-PUGE-AT-0042]
MAGAGRLQGSWRRWGSQPGKYVLLLSMLSELIQITNLFGYLPRSIGSAYRLSPTTSPPSFILPQPFPWASRRRPRRRTFELDGLCAPGQMHRPYTRSLEGTWHTATAHGENVEGKRQSSADDEVWEGKKKSYPVRPRNECPIGGSGGWMIREANCDEGVGVSGLDTDLNTKCVSGRTLAVNVVEDDDASATSLRAPSTCQNLFTARTRRSRRLGRHSRQDTLSRQAEQATGQARQEARQENGSLANGESETGNEQGVVSIAPYSDLRFCCARKGELDGQWGELHAGGCPAYVSFSSQASGLDNEMLGPIFVEIRALIGTEYPHQHSGVPSSLCTLALTAYPITSAFAIYLTPNHLG